MSDLVNPQRRQLIKASLLTGGLAATGSLLSIEARAADKATVNLQLGWLPAATRSARSAPSAWATTSRKGIELVIQAGGPNIDGVAVVASGRFEVGQVSSSPSLMLAASQDIPIRCFAIGAQEHPYSFFSLTKNPVREPKRPGRQEGRHPVHRP